MANAWKAVDLFSGCGGLTTGLERAGFDVVSAVEHDSLAAETYRLNHPKVTLLETDIRKVTARELLGRGLSKVHLLAGCPPCQGFSRVRRRNANRPALDERNWLIDDFHRLLQELRPFAVFLENVPGIERYHRFKSFLTALRTLGYQVEWRTVDLKDYAVPQRRQRVVVLSGLGFKIEFPKPAKARRTVRSAIGDLSVPEGSSNPLHVAADHSAAMLERIRAVPKDGGSRCDWPKELVLECHQKCSGFKDVYGRMAWNEPSPTITGGCINASKGRFVHPEQNRAITLLEAALLQTFPRSYRFSLRRGKYPTAEMIGNALPPEFAERVGKRIAAALEANCSG